MVLELHYWDLRGLGEAIRLQLEYLQVEYVNKHPEEEERWRKTDMKTSLKNFTEMRNTFIAEKYHKFELDFPNIPYLVDGGVRVAQSFAIMKYLARKYKKLGADTEEEMRAVDQAEGFCADLRVQLIMTWFKEGDLEQSKREYVEDLPNKLRPLEEMLGKRKWCSGDKLVYVDFAMCEALDHLEMFAPGSLECSPRVKQYKAAFDALPQISAYRNSGRFKKWPVSGGPAKWGCDLK